MTRVVVLAAGKGTRMKEELPKVLVPVKSKPMIEYLIKSIIDSGVDQNPILVVSPDNHEIIKNVLYDYPCEYAIQEKQLGTGHALYCAQEIIKEDKGHIISFYGDHPFVSQETIKKVAEFDWPVNMVTTTVPDFNEWRQNFYHWGRVIRSNNNIEEIVEFKDATTDEVKNIKEVNPGFYSFDLVWLRKNIKKLRNNNAQKEYYLTDLIRIAFYQGLPINSFSIDPREAIGINTKEELMVAESLIV
jgi:bifunctional UDP-N-acetylglucosamine pyrophosphorylase / glucosamine-1-phosphate N-acetyltransferase